MEVGFQDQLLNISLKFQMLITEICQHYLSKKICVVGYIVVKHLMG